jgi:hypothetical protein
MLHMNITERLKLHVITAFIFRRVLQQVQEWNGISRRHRPVSGREENCENLGSYGLIDLRITD